MIYLFRGEEYEKRIDRHNDSVYDAQFSDSDESDCTGSGSDSSLAGRNQWRPSRMTNYQMYKRRKKSKKR